MDEVFGVIQIESSDSGRGLLEMCTLPTSCMLRNKLEGTR